MLHFYLPLVRMIIAPALIERQVSFIAIQNLSNWLQIFPENNHGLVSGSGMKDKTPFVDSEQLSPVSSRFKVLIVKSNNFMRHVGKIMCM